MSERISKESLLRIKELRDEMKGLVNKLKSDEEWDSFTAFYVQNSFFNMDDAYAHALEEYK